MIPQPCRRNYQRNNSNRVCATEGVDDKVLTGQDVDGDQGEEVEEAAAAAASAAR